MKNLISTILDETDYFNNPYFANLRSKNFSKSDFIETQIQFFYAVKFFSRPMAALAAKIPSPELRLEIIRNVWEEHGEGNQHAFHSKTFSTFLARIGNISTDEIANNVLWPEVRAFNTTLAGVCVLDEYLIGAGAMGIIERIFCDISTWIGQSVVNNGWLSSGDLIHYNLHAELDIKHSQDFFEVLQPSWNSDKNRYIIEQGLRLGASIFNTLYSGLFEARTRRWTLKDIPVQSQMPSISNYHPEKLSDH